MCRLSLDLMIELDGMRAALSAVAGDGDFLVQLDWWTLITHYLIQNKLVASTDQAEE